MAKLDDAKVRSIRELLEYGCVPAKIARLYDVSPAVIYGIKAGRMHADKGHRKK